MKKFFDYILLHPYRAMGFVCFTSVVAYLILVKWLEYSNMNLLWGFFGGIAIVALYYSLRDKNTRNGKY